MSEAGWIALLSIIATLGAAAIGTLSRAIWVLHTDLTVLKRDVKWVMKNLNDWKFIFKSLIKDGHGTPENDSDEPGDAVDAHGRW